MTAALNPYVIPPAALLADPTRFGYRIGTSFSPSASDFWWNAQDAVGNYCLAGEPPGWEAVTYITPIDTAGGVDGGLVGPASLAPRQLDVSGVIVGSSPQQLRIKLAALRSLLAPRTSVVWEQYDWATSQRWAVVCVPTGVLQPTPPIGHQYGGEACSVAFSLLAGWPYKQLSGASPESITMAMPSDMVSGRTYAKHYNFNYGATTSPGGQSTAINQGDAYAYPVFSVAGPVNTPYISNDTLGQTFYLNAAVPFGVTVTIDSRTGVVTPGNYRLIGSPWKLAPGANNVRWRETSGGYDPRASLTIQWRSTRR